MSGFEGLVTGKLTLKKMGITEMEARAAASSSTQAVARFFIKATSYEIVPTDVGESCRLEGGFEGINILTGEEYRSPELFLPHVAESIVISMLKTANDINTEISEEEATHQTKKGQIKTKRFVFRNEIETAIDIIVSHSDSPVGYEYSAKPLVQAENTDPFAAIKSKIESKPKNIIEPPNAKVDKKKPKK
jgi:hypothetical protein